MFVSFSLAIVNMQYKPVMFLSMRVRILTKIIDFRAQERKWNNNENYFEEENKNKNTNHNAVLAERSRNHRPCDFANLHPSHHTDHLLSIDTRST